MRTVDVAVVGAGPAGAAAATELARDGREVLLIDKATFPRDKICGDGLTALALRQLEELGLVPDAVESWQWTDKCWVRSPSGRIAEFPLPTEQGHHAAVASRRDLDAALVDLAVAAGAELAAGCRVGAADESSDSVTLDVEELGRVNAKWVIAADGMWSPMRKHLGVAPEGYRGEWHAFRQYASGVTGPAAEDMFVFFEADLLPGYFWSFPLRNGRANVGFGIARGGKVAVPAMKALWADLLERDHIRSAIGSDAELEGTHRAWPIPARVDDALAATDRVMFAGDAVGACDVMTGEGIGQALLTGRLAAQAIVDNNGSADTTSDYTSRMRSELVADHKMSSILVRALKHRKGARAAVRVAAATPWTRRNFGRWLFEDYPRAVLATPRRWGREMFTPPGTYQDG